MQFMCEESGLPPPHWATIALGTWIVAILMTKTLPERQAVIQNVIAMTDMLKATPTSNPR